MTYDPDKHHRRSVRLKEYTYSQPGAYFVTICTRDRTCLLGEIVNREMRLNKAGEIARRCWEDVPDHFPMVELDAFVIMPNHVHGIIVIQGRGEASVIGNSLGMGMRMGRADASPLRPARPNGTQSGSLSAIVQNFKSISTRKMNATRGIPGTSVWQRGYYEHIVRNEEELTAIREYILGNPARWNEDENNPDVLDTGR